MAKTEGLKVLLDDECLYGDVAEAAARIGAAIEGGLFLCGAAVGLRRLWRRVLCLALQFLVSFL